jgi:hypothetical protein
MRLRRRCGNSRHDEANPISTIRVNDQNLSIKIEEKIESRVARLCHINKLSHRSNSGKDGRPP